MLAAFDPVELLDVELAGLHRQASERKAAAGRARGSGRDAVAPPELYGTIACISGFQINMVERSVRLVTPCRASDRVPDGQWELASARFDDAAKLRALLPELVARAVATRQTRERGVAFVAGLGWDATAAGFIARSAHARQRLPALPGMAEVGTALAAGPSTPRALDARRS